jgi:hypothetical protein
MTIVAREPQGPASASRPRNLAELKAVRPATSPEVEAKFRENIDAAQHWFKDHKLGRFAGNAKISNGMMQQENAGMLGLPIGPAKFVWRGIILASENFAVDKDVIGHEISHAVVTHLIPNGIRYRLAEGLQENAAIHESLADTFSHLMYPTDWTVGESGQHVRVMGEWQFGVDPRNLPEMQEALRKKFMEKGYNWDEAEAKAKDFVDKGLDGHWLADVPNMAARKIGEAIGEKDMTTVYLQALDQVPHGDADFGGLAFATQRAALTEFGKNSKQVQAVVQAWDAVGLTRDKIIASMSGSNKGLAKNLLPKAPK